VGRGRKRGLEFWHLNAGDKERIISQEMMGCLEPALPKP